MKVHVLASGSRGNSILVETGEARLLVDVGLSARRIERRLHAIEIEPDSISALVVTHEHRDHTRGMGVFARRWGVPVFIGRGTAGSCAALLDGSERLIFYRAGVAFEVGDLRIEPFLTCHDAVDPMAVTIRQPATGLKVGIATDLGTPTVPVRAALRACHLLVLEANHDDILLREGPYPWSVKARIAGRHGHLSNRAAAQLGLELAHPDLLGVVLAHLSEECNEPALAEEVVGGALERAARSARVWTARQDRSLHAIDVAALRSHVRSAQIALF